MTHRVIFAPEVQMDLNDLYDLVAGRSDPARALGYTDRIVAHWEHFATFPERGSRRDDLRPGLRITGFGRRVTIAFHITPDTVIIDRILYGGRDIEAALADLDDE